MAFVRRKINVSFKLGEGEFAEGGGSNTEISGLRISSMIIKAGGPSMGTANLQIFGMTLSKMNSLSTLGLVPTLVRRNTVTVTAGDDENGMGTVFIGTITNAWADFSNAPEVAFNVEAHTGLIEAVETTDPSSFKGSSDVSTIMSSLATKMGLSFENNGVDIKLSNAYFSGSPREQAMACAKAAGVEWIIDNGKLAIWKAGSARGNSAPLISPETGMIGYPSYTSKGIILKTLFNPSIGYGSKVKVKSDLDPAKGDWVVYNLMHELESNVPRGKWFTTLGAARPGLVVVS